MTAFDRAWDVVKEVEIGQPDKREWCEECGEWHQMETIEDFMAYQESLEPSGQAEYNWIWDRPDDDCGRKFQQAISKITWGSPYQVGNGHDAWVEDKSARNPHYDPKPMATWEPDQIARYLEIEIPELLKEIDEDTGEVFRGPLEMAQDFRRALDNYYECTGRPTGDGA